MGTPVWGGGNGANAIPGKNEGAVEGVVFPAVSVAPDVAVEPKAPVRFLFHSSKAAFALFNGSAVPGAAPLGFFACAFGLLAMNGTPYALFFSN